MLDIFGQNNYYNIYFSDQICEWQTLLQALKQLRSLKVFIGFLIRTQNKSSKVVENI